MAIVIEVGGDGIITLPNYTPRPYQLPFHKAMDSGCTRFCLVWHRRAGKELACWNEMIKRAFWHRVGSYVYFFPTSALGRRIIWEGMDKKGKRFVDYVPRDLISGQPNQVEMRIRLINGSSIQIMGTNQTLNVGINPVGCVFSEYALQNPRSWDFIRPILRENKGWGVFNFTPRGKNHAYDLHKMATDNTSWFHQVSTRLDTVDGTGEPIITDEDIEEERSEGMSEHLIQQEYYCNFELGAEGAYYARYMNTAFLEGRITNVPHDPLAQVHTAWDIGVNDETVVLFFQQCGKEIHIIDMYKNQNIGMPDYISEVRKRRDENGWILGEHFAPHDIRVREWGSGARGRLEMAEDLGFNFTVTPNMLIIDGIEMARGIFNRVWIDAIKCAYLVRALESYHKEFIESKNVYGNSPVKDWSSHSADAFRMLAIMVSSNLSGGCISEEEAENLENKYFKKHV